MSKGKSFSTGLSGRGMQIETGRDDGSQPEESTQHLEKTVGKGRIVVEIPEPYQGMRDDLVPAPMGSTLWTRRDGSQWVLFPDGSKHDPKKVGFSVEAWQTAQVLDLSPQPQVPEEEVER